MDSRGVNKEIRAQVWSELKDHGFQKRTSRTAWRQWSDGVDVVNFQSFNAYHAGVLNCTTFSFSVNLGVWFSYIPSHVGEIKHKDGQPAPQEYECHFRRHVRKRLVQPEYPRQDIWFVAEDGSNVRQAVADAASVIRDSGLAWFERFRDPEEVLRTLLEDDQEMKETWGFGNNPSPVRHYMTGYAALRLGRYEVSMPAFEAVLASEAMDPVHGRVRDALEALRAAPP